MKFITINYDFHDGNELSWIEGQNCKDSFSTHVLDFFSFDTDADDVVVLANNGNYISRKELLLNTGIYTDKQIRKAHNIHKMLVARAFKFKENK